MESVSSSASPLLEILTEVDIKATGVGYLGSLELEKIDSTSFYLCPILSFVKQSRCPCHVFNSTLIKVDFVSLQQELF